MEKEEIVLGYLIKDAESNQQIPAKFGGFPIWLYPHNIQSFECSFCKQSLTFLFQLYAPLNEQHTYHRVFYVFFCDAPKCQNNKKAFRVFRMQLSENDTLTPIKAIEQKYKTLSEQYYLETDIIDGEQFRKIGEKVIKEFKENIQQEDEEQEEQEDEEYMKNIKPQLINEEEDLEELKDQQKPADPIFQIYKGTLSKLNYPVVLYTSQPLPFKNQHINTSQKKCSTCKGPMRFEFQVNSSLLQNFTQLIGYDWGTIRIYTCKASCKGEKLTVFRQDVQLQIQQDMNISKQELQKKLQQIETQKKKKQAIKEKKKQKKKEKKQKLETQKKQKQQESQEGEGDWD